MGKLEDLIAQVDDTELRQALAAAASDMKEARNFGLVFEQHIPETVALPGLPVRRGSRVRLRSQIDIGPDHTVVKITKRTLRLQSDDGSAFDVDRSDVAALKRFGEPIYPTLTPIGELRRSDGPAHTVINGENYHALQTLLYLYEGQIDCIYIDPPYNTGARDWKYNNRYVDDQDTWRHSKWLSFIEKRLLLAKRLLKEDGILIATIDEHELHHLGMLLVQTFPDAARQMVTIVINPLGQARKQELARVEEYAYFVFLGEAAPSNVSDDLLTESNTSKRAGKVRWEWLVRGGTHSRRYERPNLFYPIFVDPIDRRVVEVGDALPKDQDRSAAKERDGLIAVWPLNRQGVEGNWRCSPEYLRELLAKGYAKVGAFDKKNKRYSFLYLGKAQIRRIESGEIRAVGRDAHGAVELEGDASAKRVTPKTVWNRLSHRAGEYGSALVKALVPGGEFPFPKSVYAVADTLRIAVGDRHDALILDFFAGSGTTTHATMLLNSEDGGDRRSILVTNNEVSAEESSSLRSNGYSLGDREWEEKGIFEHITRPRVEAALTGVTHTGTTLEGDYLNGNSKAAGFAESVEFYRLDYLDPDSVRLGDQLSAILPMLRLAAGAVGSTPQLGDGSWLIALDGPWAVLLDDARFARFRDLLDERPDITHVWLVTTSEESFARMRTQLPAELRVSMLYRDYLRNFEINTERP